MIRLKVFISSVQKELIEERAALGGLLATDSFLAFSTVPRLFEEYPAPLRPNKQAYLDLLRTCHVYLLIIGKEYGQPLADGLSATHQEYRLAQELRLPTLREAIVNAVAHRDYENAGVKITVEVFADRVVFSSPGLPPGNQRIERIGRGEGRSKARNPLVVQGLTWLEFMEERGSGIRRMRDVMKRQGLDLPRFALIEDEFTVTLPGARKSLQAPLKAAAGDLAECGYLFDPALSDNQNAALRTAWERGHTSTAWCVQNLGISRDTAWRMLEDLKEKGHLEQTGTGRGTRYITKILLECREAQRNQAQIRRKSGANQAQIRRKIAPSGASPTKPDGKPTKP
jgi:hypothetical protein